jgi:hypothetical protein
MKQSFIGLAMITLVTLGAVLSLPSCGHDQKLVSIALTPSTALFPTPQSLAVDFKAYGTYIHPPATKDITKQVTWTTDVSTLLSIAYDASLSAETVAPSNGNCGIANLWASAPEGTGGSANIVISPPATLTVNNVNDPLCPGGSSTNGTLVVTPEGNGTGTVTSSPPGITCPGSACSSTFTPGVQITLTAAAGQNSSFAGWQNCSPSQTNPEQCTLTLSSGALVNVIANFTSP